MGKSLEVTPKNIKHIKVDVLTKRYHAITQQLRRKVDVFAYHELGESFIRLRKEAQLIQAFLKKKDLEHLIAEQMTFPGMERPKRPTYVSIVEYKLFDYYQNLKQIEELRSNLEKGVEIVIPMPSCVSQYGGEGGGHGSYQSVQERLVIRADNIQQSWEIELEDLLLRIRPMERALQQLDYRQRALVKEKYSHDIEPTDLEVMDKMPFNKTIFYEVKNSALLRIAESLRLLGEEEEEEE
ncbi:hypothetical protein [Aneurinibacillus aneurinilyticus]|jgi:RinA family phage transcriptional activator|uniref:hypothetical protein n=1 Tax=Aneurinibacillus aneurinilyticus TaxID=1391 RepID=UPI0023F54B75|nr:hypothetical protein [Aneurinibacillus aneurinilyticus]